MHSTHHLPARSHLLSIGINLGLLALSSLLFALSFPSFLSQWGWYPLAYVSLVPLFLLVHRASWPEVFFYGFLYGLTTYTLYNFWLSGFHPLALIAVPLIYATYFLVVLPLLKAADSLMPRYGYLLQVAIWIAYELFRTQFYLGYSYGIIGYSQYLFPALVRLSALTGVWGVSLLVVFPGAYLGNALRQGLRGVAGFVREHWTEAAAWCALFTGAIVFGVATRVDYSDSRMWKVALVQQNSDPLAGGYEAYNKSLEISVRLSREAVRHDPDVVVWSETSVVPPIDYHTRYRGSALSYDIIRRLMEFLATQEVPYVIGNSSARLLRSGAGEEPVRVDYNAVIVYDNGQFTEPYRKTHLVPFTEDVPSEDLFPRLRQALLDAGSNQWGQGEEYTVFEVDGVRFSTPICFEDTFGYISREFVRRGAQMIVNLTNDLWSKSVVASMQHMQMAVFRATETRRTVLRSTNGGMTTIIDPNGVITAIYPPFVEGYLIGDAPVYDEGTTLYVRWGDWFAVFMSVVAAAGLAAAAAAALLRRARR